MSERVWAIGGMTLTAEIRSTRIKNWCSSINIIHDKPHMDWPVVIEKEILDKVLGRMKKV
jgi:hypothetical protein